MDKYWEAWYFLLGICENYHDPYAFRYELNAFIQALRNITFMLQSEESKPAGFEQWYAEEQNSLRSNRTLRQFVQARNLIVKQSSLATSSTAEIGLFRGRRFKLGMSVDLSPFQDTSLLMQKACEFMVGMFIDKEHSALGEQVGIRRTWIAPDLGEAEVAGLCVNALKTIGGVVERAHKVWGANFDSSFEVPDMEAAFVKLETDLDPSLLEKWGWVKAVNQLSGTPDA